MNSEGDLDIQKLDRDSYIVSIDGQDYILSDIQFLISGSEADIFKAYRTRKDNQTEIGDYVLLRRLKYNYFDLIEKRKLN